MSNDHVAEPFRSILDAIANSHRLAHAELREGMAALNRVNGVTMPKRQYVKDIRLSFEQPPIPLRNFDWRAMHDGDDEEPSRHGWGSTPEEALADLKRVDEEWEDSLTDEQERLWAEQP
jgi:hypothetical protein